IGGIKNHHRLWHPAASKQDSVLHIHREAGTSSTIRRYVVTRGHGERAGVNHSDIVLVSHIDVNPAITIRSGLLGLTTQIDRSQHGAIHSVDNRRIRRGMAEDEDTLAEGIEKNGVRAALNV